ncbi:FAD-dependent oxidoreductase [Sanguibacter suaedae]|uniref:FAD-dependent oxidoreductase n=1 Tax=Sanguibacter suaedae TaxID=2795737 RepID=A0A934M8G0_9MICO|nr:FAD-dependent oxidoreductase [Sanguibacter suaedae]MBI9113533.1 FAD-dependent oxidoreductase [Sanguibacter suaedae]
MDAPETTSLWLDPTTRPDTRPFPVPGPLVAGSRYDVAVVGAGLTGLTTALLLARAGASVVVLEARHVGAVTTGNTTAKVSLLQGTRLSDLTGRHSSETVARYVEGNREGQSWLRRYCEARGIDHQLRDAVTYAGSPDDVAAARAEHDAAASLGLPVRWQDDVGLGFEHAGGVVLPDQVQINPMDVLMELAHDLVDRGVQIHERSRVVGVDAGDPCAVHVETDQGPGARTPTEVLADRVVLATGVPVLDRGGFFARVEPLRSYATAFRVPGSLPQPMYLSAGSPTRSLRTYPGQDGELLLVGGNGHVVGRDDHTLGNVEDLVAWTQERFPGAELTHVWSAQDYQTTSHLPFVGPLTPGQDAIQVATGYDKWGMTNAVAASLALSVTLLGDESHGSMPWADAFRSWSRHEAKGVGEAARINASVGARMTTDRLKPLVPGVVPSSGSDGVPAEGEGRVERSGLRQEAVCTVGGMTFRRSASCSHLGGIVSWNDAERSWDCPLHGSRFAPDGEVLEGPAVAPLAEVSED